MGIIYKFKKNGIEMHIEVESCIHGVFFYFSAFFTLNIKDFV